MTITLISTMMLNPITKILMTIIYTTITLIKNMIIKMTVISLYRNMG